MAQFHPEWLKERQRRWRVDDTNPWARLNALRAGRVFASRARDPASARGNAPVRVPVRKLNLGHESEAELAHRRWEIARLRLDFALLKLALRARKAGFNPAQPRVPAGGPGGGQWTTEGGTERPADEGGSRADRVRLAAADGPILGPKSRLKVALELARKVIDAFRSKEGLLDLFGERVGAVTYTEVDGKIIYGSNSSLPLYRKIDAIERDQLIDRYVKEYPEMAERARRREMPVDAFSHAETNVLTRAARENDGTLAGRTLEVFGDRKLCNNCEEILPFVVRQLGNPTVTFYDRFGRVGTIRDGKWLDRK
jgi:hypothetical protein